MSRATEIDYRPASIPPEKLTQILELFESPDNFTIPPLMEEWAASTGRLISLQSAHQDNVAGMQGYGMLVLYEEDLPESVDGFEGNFREAAVKEARRLNYIRRDGQFFFNDCCLYVFPEERRQAMEDQAYMRFRIQDLGSIEEAVNALAEGTEEIAGRNSKYFHAAVSDDTARTISEHVRGGPGAIPRSILRPSVPRTGPRKTLGGGPVVRRRTPR
jgi:hypothetical protein